MKIAFYNGAPGADIDKPVCVSVMDAIPRQGELVIIDLITWVVYRVGHHIMPNDEPHVSVILMPRQ